MKIEWVLTILAAVALVYGFAPWPTPWLTEQVLRRLYPACFNPFVRCRLPSHEVHLGVDFALLGVTYAAVLGVYFAFTRATAHESPSEV
jgi:hypothetical protein